MFSHNLLCFCGKQSHMQLLIGKKHKTVQKRAELSDSESNLWASARVPAGSSVPTTQSQKERGGDYHAMASCQGVLKRGLKESERGWV